MKHLKKTLAIFASIGLVAISYSAPLGVDTIDVIDANTLEVTLSENPNMNVGEIDAEITILSDVKLHGGFISENSAKQVELLLETPLQALTNYSLLSVLGAKGSIDFVTPEEIGGYTTVNTANMTEQDIESIEIIDDKTIFITYTQDLSASTFEYKLLAESNIVKVEKQDYDIPKLTITVEPPFTSEQDYILMFIDMQDVEGNYIEFDTGIYDFTSPIIEENTSEELWDEEVINNDTLEEAVWEDEQISLESANDETSLEKDSSVQDTNEVAMSAELTPNTGAQTWILVLMTLVINSFYYFTRRKKLQVL